MKPIRHPSPVNRRHFLRGLGVSVVLPGLSSMTSTRLAAGESMRAAATSASGAPLRTAFVYFPNGAIPDLWWPEGGGKDFSLGETLNPLESMKDSVQVMQGLDQLNANRGNDGGGDHARGNSVFLTGVRINKSTTDIRAGVSIDQAIAKEVGHLTRFASLELSCFSERKTGTCDTGYSCAYQSNVAWKTPTNPMTPESNPRKVFERLFGEGTHGERAAHARLRMLNRQSVLDFVMTDARKMQQRLDRHDREKLDQYLNGIREVEIRIQNLEKFGMPYDPDRATPAGVPTTHGEHIEIMYEMLLLAFQTDSTRVATLMMAYDGDNRSHQEIGIREGHHELSHHQNRPDRVAKVGQIDRWYVQKFADFLRRMESIQDIDGNSMLHNSMVLYGSGNADGNKHTHENLPILLAGQGGGTLQAGRFVKHGSQPATNLFLSLAERMGANELVRIGDSTGPLVDV